MACQKTGLPLWAEWEVFNRFLRFDQAPLFAKSCASERVPVVVVVVVVRREVPEVLPKVVVAHPPILHGRIRREGVP